jgi:hypothetical protein
MTDTTVQTNAGDPHADHRRLAMVCVIAVLAVALGYVAIAVPGSWFPRADVLGWGARQLQLVRGTGTLVGDELVVTAPGPDGSVLISLETDFRTDQYPGIAWFAIDLPEGGDVRFLWRNDVTPTRVSSVAVTIESGRPRVLSLADHPAWVGRIKGIALLIATRIDKPLHVRGAVAKPMGAFDLLADRAREWFAFEPWTGESIDSVAGGADLQDLPLPVLIVAIVSLALALLLALMLLGRRSLAFVPMALIVLFAGGWLVLDARSMVNLVRQVMETASRYRGLDWREKHVAAEDGELFAFVERARAELPAAPVRVFVAAEAHYFRGRAAYHLYPHNVFYDPLRDTLPRADQMRSGDWILIFRRRGAQYDAAAKRLRWDAGAPIAAELKLAGSGAALFRVE